MKMKSLPEEVVMCHNLMSRVQSERSGARMNSLRKYSGVEEYGPSRKAQLEMLLEAFGLRGIETSEVSKGGLEILGFSVGPRAAQMGVAV